MTEWVNHLLVILQWLQHLVLTCIFWLTGTVTEFGQPAWIFSRRIAAEMLRIDHGLARQMVASMIGASVLLLLLVVWIVWKRRRWQILIVFVVVLWVVPWPSSDIVLTDAYPTSFHQSTTGFSTDTIVQGGDLYRQYCVSCHGVDGKGQGELAASLKQWPPNLASQLLGSRADGEVAWRIMHGMQSRTGEVTMPGFQGRITPDEVWSLMDYMKALAAGEGAKRDGVWPIPVPLPDFVVTCDKQAPTTLRMLRNRQRVRLVATGSSAPVIEDPRLWTIMVGRKGSAVNASNDIACSSDDDGVWQSLALIAGTTSENFSGVQFLADRDGWLRARTVTTWGSSDFLCRSDEIVPTNNQADTVLAGGLDDLIQRMDKEPVQYVKGGFSH